MPVVWCSQIAVQSAREQSLGLSRAINIPYINLKSFRPGQANLDLAPGKWRVSVTVFFFLTHSHVYGLAQHLVENVGIPGFFMSQMLVKNHVSNYYCLHIINKCKLGSSEHGILPCFTMFYHILPCFTLILGMWKRENDGCWLATISSKIERVQRQVMQVVPARFQDTCFRHLKKHRSVNQVNCKKHLQTQIMSTPDFFRPRFMNWATSFK